MAKETFYFSHDYNARNDRKISALLIDYKSSGYGVFWCAAEMMHEEGDALEYDEITFSAIAKDLNETCEFIKEVIGKCVSKYKLFVVSENNVLSANRVKRNLQKRADTKEGKSKAGKASAEKRKESTHVQHVFNTCSTHVQQNSTKESKVKESKVNSITNNINGVETGALTNYNLSVWRKDVSDFLKDKIWKENFCAAKGIKLNELEKSLNQFVIKLNLQEDYKNIGGLKKHYTNHYNKYGLIVSEMEEKKNTTQPKIKLN